MKKACGTWLLVYLVLGAAIGAIVYRRFPVAAIPAAIFGGFLAWVGIAYFGGIARKFSAMRTIGRAQRGDPPRDGEPIAAIGRIVPVGATLASPLTRTPCVAYAYSIRFGAQEPSYSGFALTSSAIQGAQGSLRLLSNPKLNVPEEVIPAERALKNAEEFLETAVFNQPNLADLKNFKISAVMPPDADEKGNVQYNKHHRALGHTDDLGGATFSEQLVLPGEPVCVLGNYSAARGGVVLDPKASFGTRITLEKGAGSIFVVRAVRSAIGYLIAGIIFLGLATAGVLAVLAFVPLEAAEQMNPSMNPSWPEIRLEHLIERRLRTPMRQAGMLASNSGVTVMLSAGAAHGRVRVGGRDDAVSRAVAVRDNTQTVVTIDDGAAVMAVDRRDHLVALRLFGQEVPVASADAQIVGDQEEIVGRVSALVDNAASTGCRIAFRAKVRSGSAVRE